MARSKRTEELVITVSTKDPYGGQWNVTFDAAKWLQSFEKLPFEVDSVDLEAFLRLLIENRINALALDLHYDAVAEALASVPNAEFVPFPKDKSIEHSPYVRDLRRSRRGRKAGRVTAWRDPNEFARKLIAAAAELRKEGRRQTQALIAEKIYSEADLRAISGDGSKKLRDELTACGLSFKAIKKLFP